MGKSVGIDLETTNSVIAIWETTRSYGDSKLELTRAKFEDLTYHLVQRYLKPVGTSSSRCQTDCWGYR